MLPFYADWDGISKEMTPTIEALEREGYVVRKVNADKEPKLAKKFGVNAVPWIVVLDKGKEVYRIRGRTTLDSLRVS